MSAFIWTMLVMYLLAVGISLTHTAGPHPRIRKPATFGDDAFILAAHVAIAAWIIWLLTRA